MPVRKWANRARIRHASDNEEFYLKAPRQFTAIISMIHREEIFLFAWSISRKSEIGHSGGMKRMESLLINSEMRKDSPRALMKATRHQSLCKLVSKQSVRARGSTSTEDSGEAEYSDNRKIVDWLRNHWEIAFQHVHLEEKAKFKVGQKTSELPEKAGSVWSAAMWNRSNLSFCDQSVGQVPFHWKNKRLEKGGHQDAVQRCSSVDIVRRKIH
jgi:hypothetical protein